MVPPPRAAARTSEFTHVTDIVDPRNSHTSLTLQTEVLLQKSDYERLQRLFLLNFDQYGSRLSMPDSAEARFARAQARMCYFGSIASLMRGDDWRSLKTTMGHVGVMPLPESVGPHQGHILYVLKVWSAAHTSQIGTSLEARRPA